MKKPNPRYLLDPKLFAEHGPVVLGGPHAEPVESRLILRVSSYPVNHPSATHYPLSNLSNTVQLTVSIFSCLNATAAAMDCETSYPIEIRGKAL